MKLNTLVKTFLFVVLVLSITITATAQEETSSENIGITVYTGMDIVSGEPEVIALLQATGMTATQISQLQQDLALGINSLVLPTSRPAISYSTIGNIDTFNNSCSVSKTGHIIFQTGQGSSTSFMTYTDGTTGSGLSYTCTDSTCLVHVWSQRNGKSTDFWTVTNTSYSHKLHTWCTNS